jgi:curved DNA-binding protein CbpA
VVNPYEVLGVAPDATPEQIRAAYKKLVKELHPDKRAEDPYRAQKEERLKKVNVAYDQLKKSFSADADTKRKAEQTKRKAEEAARRRATEAAKRRAAEAAKRRATGQPPRKEGEEDAEAAAARFWKAFNKSEQDLKRKV